MADILYSDSLIEVSDDSILFRHYYFPACAKQIKLSSIDHVEILMPSISSGKWRIHGTGDFRTWFPRDKHRPDRDCIFVLHRNNSRWRIGFTVEDSKALNAVLRQRHIRIKSFIPIEHFEPEDK